MEEISLSSEPCEHHEKDYWLRFLNDAGLDEPACEQYAAIFVENEMTPDMMREFTHGLLIMLGVKKAGHRMKILHLKGILIETGGHLGPASLHLQKGHQLRKSKPKKKRLRAKSSPHASSTAENLDSSNRPKDGSRPDTAEKPEQPVEAQLEEEVTENAETEEGKTSDVLTEEEESEKNSTIPPFTPLRHSNSLPTLLIPPIAQSLPEEAQKAKPVLTNALSSPSLSLSLPNNIERPEANGPRHHLFPGKSKSEFNPYVEIDVSPRVLGDNDLSSANEALDRSPQMSHFRLWRESTIPAHIENTESGASTSRFYDQISEGARKSVVIGRSGRVGSDEYSAALMANLIEVKYYFNLETDKRYEHINRPVSQAAFSLAVSSTLKLQIGNFVIFHLNDHGEFEPLKKSDILEPHEIYYVIESDKLRQKILGKLKSRLKNEKVILDSTNTPMDVDFVDPKHLYMDENGKIGICMAPGRKKKKKRHIWQRDLGQDLDRLQQVYGCNVLVTLVREQELRDLRITELFDELKKRNIASLFLPIKDKWIPKSTTDLIALVQKIIFCLKQGKTVVVHCNGGKGRSATVIVATLVAMGRSITDSIRIIQQTRKGTIRNPLQQAYLRRFRKEWNEKQKRTTLLKGLGLSEDVEADSASGAEEESELDSESEFDSDDDGSSLEFETVGEEDLTKKLHRFEKRIESYEKKIEKRERALAKDRERLEFYREEWKKIAEKKGSRIQQPLKRSKSVRGVKDNPLKASTKREIRKEVPQLKEDKEDRKERKGEDKEGSGKDKKDKDDKKEKELRESEAKKEKKKEDKREAEQPLRRSD